MTTTEPTTDREAVLARYRAERDKRLREDGNDQYVEVTGAFAHYVEDPYVPRTERDPLRTEVDVALVGGGFSGLVTGARLKEAGITDVRIIEKGGDVGGTWYWNRYPGAQCDTHSFVYMPLLEETGHMPSEKYAHGPEILEHCQRIATQYDLYDGALLHTEVQSVEWSAEESRWIIGTDRGDELRARFVVWGTGPLHRPKLPGIPGLGTFEGHTFHTSRWDYDYTGGTPDGEPMTGLADKRVGIIGTGATAVQCVPHLARNAGELYVFQRTPSSIDVRANEPTDPEWFESEVLEPGWQQRWMASFTAVQTGNFGHEDLVQDGWTDISRRVRDKILSDPEATFTIETFQRAFEDSDFEKMEAIRSRVDEIVQDQATAAALKPWYRQLCKRPCFHDEYLDAYNRPTAHLIDTDGQGVEKITPKGLVVGGVEYELDCIIFASGFEVGTDHARRSGFDPVGRDGETLSEHWSGGMRTLHGMHVHGFPNAFILQAAQGANLISNYPHNLSEGGKTIAAIVRHALDEGITEVEATAEAEDAWMRMLVEEGRAFGAGFLADCTPGYYNNEGRPAEPGSGIVAVGYPEGPVAFFALMDAWRTSGDFEGLALR
jgi:cation diffusion facilitator CzcD-associated flavoprotein CzcO